MTIHWKALEEHFLMVPLVFLFTHFWGQYIILNFSQTTSVLELKSNNTGLKTIQACKSWLSQSHTLSFAGVVSLTGSLTASPFVAGL
jgi:glucose-6-phosphate-specific signal transduction histidine kinase